MRGFHLAIAVGIMATSTACGDREVSSFTKTDPGTIPPPSSAASGGATGAGGSVDPGPKLGPKYCPDVPAGYMVGEAVGEVLPNYALRHCDGSEASLEELCGAKGLFLFAAHGWCTVCQSVSVQLEALQAEYAAEGLATALVLVDSNEPGEPPDGDLCNTWRNGSEHDTVLTLYDPEGTLISMWGGGSTLSAYIDEDRIIRSKLSGVGNLDSIREQIEAVLE